MATAALPAERYSTGAIWFHWVIAALVVFNIIVGLFHDGVPALRALMGTHKAVGVTVLVLTLGRIAWRLAHRPPPLPAHLAAWETAAARLVRGLFYALLLIMPLSGWVMVSTSTHPRPFTWFGLFEVPFLGFSHAANAPAGTTHAVLGYLFAALVVLHVGAALRHHFILRDSVLGRVIPGLLPRA